MNASELRIGNYLENFLGEFFQVNVVTINSFLVNHHQFPEPKPIPITEDWLEKFGFIPDQNRLLWSTSETFYESKSGDKGHKVPSFFFNNRLNRWMDCQTRVCVDYVHQLQNLFYCLTGEELTYHA